MEKCDTTIIKNAVLVIIWREFLFETQLKKIYISYLFCCGYLLI